MHPHAILSPHEIAVAKAIVPAYVDVADFIYRVREGEFNEHLAKRYGVEKRTIQNWKAKLREQGFTI